jgi:hypothetical protein
MKAPLIVILVAVAVLAVSTLAIMNNACKSSQHEWCAPMSRLRHQIKNRAQAESSPSTVWIFTQRKEPS